MNGIIAYTENNQAYILPSPTAEQPRFIPEQSAVNLKKLNWDLIEHDWAKDVTKYFLSSILKQRLYVWWMGLDNESKQYFFDNSIGR